MVNMMIGDNIILNYSADVVEMKVNILKSAVGIIPHLSSAMKW